MKFNLIFFIILALCQQDCSFKNNKQPDGPTRFAYLNIKDTIGQVETKELVLAREVCMPEIFDMFCYNRVSPYFVHLNFDDFLLSYDSFIYTAQLTKSIVNKRDSLDFEYSGSWVLDTLFNHKKDDFNIIKFKVPNHYFRRVNRYAKKNYNNTFDGTAKYALYKLKFQCVYVGQQTIFISNMKRKKSKRENYILSRVYFITKIIDYKPIHYLKKNTIDMAKPE